MNIRAILGAFGLFVGFAAASFAGVRALEYGNASGTSESGLERYEVSAPVQPIAPTTGTERPVFEYSMSGIRSNELVRVISVDDSGVCLVVALDDAMHEGCADAQAISTGLVYAAFGRETGGFTVIGVVPDSVDNVRLGTTDVTIEGNIWLTDIGPADANAALTLAVGSSASGIVTSTGSG